MLLLTEQTNAKIYFIKKLKDKKIITGEKKLNMQELMFLKHGTYIYDMCKRSHEDHKCVCKLQLRIAILHLNHEKQRHNERLAQLFMSPKEKF